MVKYQYGRLNVRLNMFILIHNPNFLDLFSEKFSSLASCYQDSVNSLALFSKEADVEQMRFNLRA